MEMRKELKHVTTKRNLLSIKEDSNIGNEGQKINYNKYGKQIGSDRSSSILIITLNVDGLNYPIKTDIRRMEKTLSNYTLSTRNSF